MISINNQFQNLYHLALAIGDGKNQQEAAELALSGYLQKLDCFAGAIYKKEVVDNKCRYKPFSSNPAGIESNASFKGLTENLSWSPKKCTKDFDGIKKAHLKYFDDGTHGYIFELPGFGLMALLKRGEAFSEQFIQNLLPLCKKLADVLLDFGTKERLNLLSEADTNAVLNTKKNTQAISCR